jgi:photosystem II stability/assembly factor-like uncharacterized protein
VLDTGTSREILTVFEDGETLVAGGEEAFLARSTDRGRSWQRVPAPDRGAIVHVTRRPNGGLLAVSMLDRAVAVWESTGTAWQLSNQFPVERSFNVGGALPPHVVSSATRLYVAMPNGAIHAFDFGSGQWQRHEASFSLIALALAGDALYGYGAQFLHSIWMSEDGGKTWRDIGTSRRAGAPVFTDPRTGYVLYIKEIYGTAISVQATKDGGRTWAEFGVLPKEAAGRVLLFRPMLVHPSGTLLVFGTNGAVWATRDLGMNWTEERRGF